MARKTTTIHTTIRCPHCGKDIPLDDVLTNQIREEIQSEYEGKIKRLENKQSQQIKKALVAERKKIAEEEKRKATKSMNLKLKDLGEEVKEERERADQLEKKVLQANRLERQMKRKEKELERKAVELVEKEREGLTKEIQGNVHEEYEMKFKEKDKEMADFKAEIRKLKQKTDVTSQQLQGEVQELDYEEQLSQNFIHDEFVPVKSGTRGPDVLQKVHTRNGTPCGIILHESKRTKNWQDKWISKLKEDLRDAKADIGVIATRALPKDVQTFAFIRGVLVVDYKLAIPLTSVLRNWLMDNFRLRKASESKTAKMGLLSEYLTGPDFRHAVEGIVEAFGGMYQDLEKERRALQRLWKKREKQIQLGMLNLVNLYGGMQGILGASLPEIKSLEMPESLAESTAKESRKK